MEIEISGDYKINLEQSPSAIKFLSSSVHNPQLVVATYQLPDNKDSSGRESKREGSVFVFALAEESAQLGDHWYIKNRIALDGGVFRFELGSNNELLAALTTGRISFLGHLDSGAEDIAASSVHNSQQITRDMTLNATRNSNNEGEILCSGNKGELVIVNGENGHFVAVDEWRAHALPYANCIDGGSSDCEVWTACWLPSLGRSLLASGADDAQLKVWDLRLSASEGRLCRANKDCHQAGITYLMALGESALISGSYDNHIRKFDLRNLKTPVQSKQVSASETAFHLKSWCHMHISSHLQLNGGVWNLELVDGHPQQLMAACMYGRCSIVDISSLEIVDCLPPVSDDKEELQYGATSKISKATDGTSEMRLANCYFTSRTIEIFKISDPLLHV